MQKIKTKCLISAWHLRISGLIEDYCTKNGIKGYCIKDNKKAKLNSILELFFLHVTYGKEVIFEIQSGDAEKFKNFLDGLR